MDDVSIKAPDKTLAIAGAIAGVIPFFMSVSSSSSVTVNGHVTASTYRDNVAIGGGAVALVCGLIALALAVKHKGGAARIGAAVVVLALGGYQLARGFGVFEKTADTAMTVDTGPVIPAAPPAPKGPCADADSCQEVGLAFKKDNQLDKAFAAWSHGCELGGAVSCQNAGVYWDQLVAKPDPKKALPFYEKGCKLDAPGACLNLGSLLYAGSVGPKDPTRALELFEKACAAGRGVGCRDVGVIYREGADPIKPDRAKAIAALEKACGLKDGGGCKGLGDLYNEAKDEKKAFATFESACTDDMIDGCFDEALMLVGGKGGHKPDLPKARKLYGVACDHDDFSACNNLAVMVANGRGGAKDKAKAKELYQKACDGKIEIACTNAKAMK